MPLTDVQVFIALGLALIPAVLAYRLGLELYS